VYQYLPYSVHHQIIKQLKLMHKPVLSIEVTGCSDQSKQLSLRTPGLRPLGPREHLLGDLERGSLRIILA